MEINDIFLLAAPCGIYCGECPPYKAKDNPKLLEHLVTAGMKRDALPCPGCRAGEGRCPAIAAECETYLCVKQKEVDFCYQCKDFPCEKLNPAADRANVLPHNLKVFNLCSIMQKGLERFANEAPEIQRRYYRGVMKIGRGPQVE